MRERKPNQMKTPYPILRYLPLTPCMQRLYASDLSAEQKTSHANHQTEERSMCHPSDVEAWRHFDQTYLDFTTEPRNARLGLYTNDFAPQGKY
ncbi:UNVERIFIED_CONTAM: hypothetical protein Scaly_1661900 [Sesamum calycinum]|uniref:Uncharacterized protein n=1 Tax=Sesamum calycinum TaxID=2727403 RepID=A0AAW2NRP8_9LAMI